MSSIAVTLRSAIDRVSSRCLSSRSDRISRFSTYASSSSASSSSASSPWLDLPYVRKYACASSTNEDDNHANNFHDGGIDDDNYDDEDVNYRYVSRFSNFYQMIQEGRTSMGTTELFRPERRYLKCGLPEDVLRFHTVNYGRLLEAPFVQRNEHKVTVVVATDDLPLDEVEREILREIVGARYNEDRRQLQLSSEQFGSRIENKRHLMSILDRVILAAKNLAKEMPNPPPRRLQQAAPLENTTPTPTTTSTTTANTPAKEK